MSLGLWFYFWPSNASLAVTEADDASAATATVLVTGALSVTEANDTLTAATTLLVTATLSVTEADDALAATATVAISASLNATDANDSIPAAAAQLPLLLVAGQHAAVLVTTTLAATEADDAPTVSVIVDIIATLDVAEADVLTASGVVSGVDLTGQPIGLLLALTVSSASISSVFLTVSGETVQDRFPSVGVSEPYQTSHRTN